MRILVFDKKVYGAFKKHLGLSVFVFTRRIKQISTYPGCYPVSVLVRSNVGQILCCQILCAAQLRSKGEVRYLQDDVMILCCWLYTKQGTNKNSVKGEAKSMFE